MRRPALILFAAMLLPPSAEAIVGDCDEDGVVDVAELIRGVTIALGTRPLSDCEAFDADGDGVVDIAELIAAVDCAIRQRATETASPTATPTSTGSPVATSTDTPPASVTATGSPASTATPTSSAVETTATATPTSTSVATESETPTATPTPTSAATPTATSNATASPSATATDTSVPDTPTVTPATEPSSTATAIHSATETALPTPTDTPAVSPTHTATSTDTPVVSPTHTATPTTTATPQQIAALDFAIAAVNGIPCMRSMINFRLLANISVDVRDLRIDFCTDPAAFAVPDITCTAVPGTAVIDTVEHQADCDLDQPDPRGQVRAVLHGVNGGNLPAGQVFLTCGVDTLPPALSGVYPVPIEVRGTTAGDQAFVDSGQGSITVAADALPLGQCCGADAQCELGFCRGGYVPQSNSVCCESDCGGGVCNDPSGPPGTCLEQPGGEFRVSTIDYRSQLSPAVAGNSSGFVVAWEGNNPVDIFTNGRDIFARRFDRFGAAVGSELTVNESLPGNQQAAAVAILGTGFVVAWTDLTGIFAQRFDSLGERAGTEFQVSTYTDGGQDTAAIGAASDGSFVVAWDTLDQDGNGQGIFGRRYDSSGASIGSEFQVNTYTNGAEQAPAIDVAGDASFVVVWEDVGRGVAGQRFNSLGTRIGTEFLAPDLAAGAIGPFFPSLAILPAGDFVVAGANLDATYSTGVFARRYSSAAAPLGDLFQVNTFTYDAQKFPKVAADDDGGFVIVWRSDGQDFYQYGIFGQRFAASGERVGTEFIVNAYTASDEREQAIGTGAGGFVVVWQGYAGGSFRAILGRRLE